ncbi:hypothetical protein A3Q56_05796 [Intoshia linei]|uniref:Uncharacterized protein n=1 Tax=Intoshia linei TaxID=1819745 RepID=A0A177AWV9_9BILA|nr:hypothetical protein A3Q56_05796 [Intoshia linei]
MIEIGAYDCLSSNPHMTEIAYVSYTNVPMLCSDYETNSTLDYKCSIINENFTSTECKYGYVYNKYPVNTSITTE